MISALIGPAINSILVLLGGLVGLLLKKGISQRYEALIMQGLGATVIVIGLSMGLESAQLVVVVVSIAIGAVIGEWIDIDKKIENLGNRLKAWFSKKNKDNSRFTEAFVTATFLMCIGSMGINGALDSGISGDYDTLIVKGVIDFFACIILAASIHPSAMLAAIPIFLYQGFFAVFAVLIKEILPPMALVELSATGGIMVLMLGLNLMGITKIKVANFLPALLLAPPLALLLINILP